MGPASSRPPTAQRAASGSPGQPGNSLLTPELAQAHQEALRTARMAAYQASLNTRYRTYYRQLLEQFLTIILPSSTIGSTTIFPPYSGQGFTIEGRTRAEQWQQPSSSSSVFNNLGQEWTMLQPDKQALVPVQLTPPAKAK